MDVQKDHVVHLVNGQLRDGNPRSTTTRADVRRVVHAALARPDPELVIHFHGGLVSEKSGRQIAEFLAPRYASASRYPLFFVWESGFLEAVRNNLSDIGHDPLFQELVKKASLWVLRQLPGAVGLKGAGGMVDKNELEREYDDWFRGRRATPPTALQPATASAPVLKSATPPSSEHDLAQKIRLDLQNDSDFSQVYAGLHASISPSNVAVPVPKASGVGQRVSPLTEVSPEKAGDVFDITPQTKGVITLAKVALVIAKIVIAVVRRFMNGRAHGVYTTIVEETLAAVYVDKIGGVIWGQMKQDTADAFSDPARSGGAALLDAIASEQAASGKAFRRIVLVGHSTGAIYICNFIDHAATSLPGALFDVVFLAPAVTHARFSRILQLHQARIAHFRQFGMRDGVESDDVLVPIVYLRSLLYFVSGVVEFDDDGNGGRTRQADAPIVGMERYRLDPATFSASAFPDIAAVEAFYEPDAKRLVWSVTDDTVPPGQGSKSRKHGDFDNDSTTLAALADILANGY